MKTFLKFCLQAWDISQVYDYGLDADFREIRSDVRKDVSNRLDNYLKKNNKK